MNNDRGFVIVACNTDTVDYVRCATVLAHSIKHCMPDSNISILTNVPVHSDIFHHVIVLPCDTNNDVIDNLAVDWMVYWHTPYQYTIKLEADMYIPRSIDHWWDILDSRDIHICTTIRNYYNEISVNHSYRDEIYDNLLPDTYNAITLFKKSPTAELFYSTVRHVFEHWDEYRDIYKLAARASTDIVYGIASTVIGEEHTTIPTLTDISMIHMKPKINNGKYYDWTCEYMYELVTGDKNILRVNSSTINYPFHYHIKNFADIIGAEFYD